MTETNCRPGNLLRIKRFDRTITHMFADQVLFQPVQSMLESAHASMLQRSCIANTYACTVSFRLESKMSRQRQTNIVQRVIDSTRAACKRLGVVLTAGEVMDRKTEWGFCFDAWVMNKDGIPATFWIRTFNEWHQQFNLDKEDLGREFELGKEKWQVIGIRFTPRRLKLVIRRVGDWFICDADPTIAEIIAAQKAFDFAKLPPGQLTFLGDQASVGVGA